jgi:RNA polymerase sigma factor (sigma-70 family)
MDPASSHNDDKEILEQLFSGKREGGRIFLKQFGALIHSAVCSVDLRSDAINHEDLFMEALTHIFDKDCKVLKTFKWKCKLSSYLYAVSRRYALDRIGRENRAYSMNCNEILPDTLMAECNDNEEEHSHDEMQRAVFKEAFDALDPKDALFIKMLCLEKQATSEVMQFFGWNSENTVYARKNKVIAKLRTLSRKTFQRRGVV